METFHTARFFHTELFIRVDLKPGEKNNWAGADG